MARVALELVELGDEGDRHLLLGGDLLGARLVDHVVVGGLERLAVVEVDLVLAEVALALRVLDDHLGGLHLVADAADQRLDAGGPEQRIVDVVEVRRLEVAVGLLPRLLVAVLEDDELELGAREGLQPSVFEAAKLAAQDLPRRSDDLGAVLPLDIGEQHHGALVPRDGPQRVQVGLHHEVAVAARPTKTSRSPRRCPYPRRRRAGSCIPRRRARASRRGSTAPSGACPGAFPPCPRLRGARCPPCPPLSRPSAHRASIQAELLGVLHVESLLAREPLLRAHLPGDRGQDSSTLTITGA